MASETSERTFLGFRAEEIRAEGSTREKEVLTANACKKASQFYARAAILREVIYADIIKMLNQRTQIQESLQAGINNGVLCQEHGQARPGTFLP